MRQAESYSRTQNGGQMIGGEPHTKTCIFKSVFEVWCFGFLDTSVVAYRLYGSNSQG